MENKLPYRKIERVVKGFANHRRIQILELLSKEPELSVIEIAEKIKSEFKNVSAHINKMTVAGLLIKRNAGHSVRHKVTKLGEYVLKFVRIIE